MLSQPIKLGMMGRVMIPIPSCRATTGWKCIPAKSAPAMFSDTHGLYLCPCHCVGYTGYFWSCSIFQLDPVPQQFCGYFAVWINACCPCSSGTVLFNPILLIRYPDVSEDFGYFLQQFLNPVLFPGLSSHYLVLPVVELWSSVLNLCPIPRLCLKPQMSVVNWK